MSLLAGTLVVALACALTLVLVLGPATLLGLHDLGLVACFGFALAGLCVVAAKVAWR